MFTTFTTKLKQALQENLPGEPSQLLMAPGSRASTEEYLKYNPNPKKSCVLILFYPKENVPHLVLTLRSEYKGAHSGQVSFPGGKIEETDLTLEDTAIRETREEVGVESTNFQIIGQLTGLYIPVSGFWVYPFVAVADQHLTFFPDSKEVKQLIEVPLKELVKENIASTTRVKIKGIVTLEVPCFTIQGHIVWGATAMMLSELRAVLVKALK